MNDKLTGITDTSYSTDYKAVKEQAIVALNNPRFTEFCLFVAGPNISNMISISNPLTAALASVVFAKKAGEAVKLP